MQSIVRVPVLFMAVAAFLRGEQVVRKAKWLTPAGEPVLVRDFTKVDIVRKQWRSNENMQVVEAKDGTALVGVANDPFLETKLPDVAKGPLLVSLRYRAEQFGKTFVYWRDAGEAFHPSRSVESDIFASEEFVDISFFIDGNASVASLRLDPFEDKGRMVLKNLIMTPLRLAREGAVCIPPSGDAVIRGPALGSEIVVTTTSRLAGAIHSLTWKGQEFIDSHDHGRQLQSASNFDAGSRFHAETFNPTEAGSRNDGADSASTSRLLSISTTGNRLETISQMAFWLAPGQTSKGRTAKNKTLLSSHLLKKNLSIGHRNFPNILPYDITFTVPPGENHRYAQFEVLTGYMPAEFSKFWKFVPESGKLAPLSDGPGEQPFPVVLSTPNGSHAMACVPRESPSENFRGPGYGRFRYTSQKTVKWNIVYRLQNKQGIPPADYSFHLFVIIGDLETVRSTLVEIGLPQSR